MKKIKTLKIALTIFINMTLFLSFKNDVFALEGWTIHNGEHCYINNNGEMLINTWKESNGFDFYLMEDGYIARNELLEYGNHLYYFDEDGHKVTNKYIYIDENLDPDGNWGVGLHYFGHDGRLVKGSTNNVKKTIDGKNYAINETGVILTGWLDVDGMPIEDSSEILTSGVYYADPETAILYQNQWLNFSHDIGAYNYGDIESNHISDRYDDMDSLWMYFDNNCRKYVSNSELAKGKTINNKRYAFDNNGILVLGFTKNNQGIDDSQQSNPTLNENVKLFDPKEGSVMTNKWHKDAPGRDMDEVDHNDDSESWFYANQSGVLLRNCIRTIDGKKYIFDGVGRMKTGFCLTDASYFVASFKPEELSRYDFIFSYDEGSKLYGKELSDIRYCGEDDSDGALRKGDHRIELYDGVYSFSFDNNGRAIGGQDELRKKGKSYYMNGLKMAAWNDMKYGILKISDTEYKVLNQNGVALDNNKKLLKDDYDNYMVILGGKLVAYIQNPGDNIKIKWVSNPEDGGIPGYYYYNKDKDPLTNKTIGYYALCVGQDQLNPTEEQLKLVPEDLKINYR